VERVGEVSVEEGGKHNDLAFGWEQGGEESQAWKEIIRSHDLNSRSGGDS